ncbi:putative 2-keto-3-deoxy-galactonate aldolase YagE [Roseimaritima ulvae]|uniref:Putative 2-keto-3-deoxy-galactonate aldolase YagE n=2 Tax=Roseimaritima ulvae TaxID=980254 RepID=A0A5B9QNN4_9BACT|nr:putative 2-keto-3-deoxy-galactonate aldolase YagE [Roseimaritima ulvae]
MVTPLRGPDEIDFDGASRLIERLIEGGVAGLFILGTTGEAPSLSYRLRGEFIRFVCKTVDKRVPVLVGVTDTSVVESIAVAGVAADAGADAVVLSMPYYFPAGQTELVHYIRRLVPQLPLPVMLYNMPSLTKVNFDIESLAQLTDLSQVIGVKDSGGDLAYFERLTALKQQRPDWSVLIGPEHLMATSLGLGGDGGVNGGANIYPKLFVRCYQATRDGDQAAETALQNQIEKLQAIYLVGKYASRHIKGTKSALSILGICDDKLAEPFNHFEPPERARVAEVLESLNTDLIE